MGFGLGLPAWATGTTPIPVGVLCGALLQQKYHRGRTFWWLRSESVIHEREPNESVCPACHADGNDKNTRLRTSVAAWVTARLFLSNAPRSRPGLWRRQNHPSARVLVLVRPVRWYLSRL